MELNIAHWNVRGLNTKLSSTTKKVLPCIKHFAKKASIVLLREHHLQGDRADMIGPAIWPKGRCFFNCHPSQSQQGTAMLISQQLSKHLLQQEIWAEARCQTCYFSLPPDSVQLGVIGIYASQDVIFHVRIMY